MAVVFCLLVGTPSNVLVDLVQSQVATASLLSVETFLVAAGKAWFGVVMPPLAPLTAVDLVLLVRSL
jgi:hypothetical protein